MRAALDPWHGIPRLALSRSASPVQSFDFGAGRSLLVKRDDLLEDAPCAGNKLRKLEFLLAAAAEPGTLRGVLTVGPEGSHHVHATACCCRLLGLDVEALLFPRHPTAESRAMVRSIEPLLTRRYFVPHKYLLPLAMGWHRMRVAMRPGVAWVPPGGSSACGCLGFVRAAEELHAQHAEGLLDEPAAIVVALGTGGTAAGLWAGLALLGWPVPVVAVRVVERVVANLGHVRGLARRTLALCARAGLKPKLPLGAVPFRVEQGHFGGRYGRPTPEGEEAARRAAAIGLTVEPTYTAKALACALEMLGEGEGRRPPLFWQTYGCGCGGGGSTG